MRLINTLKALIGKTTVKEVVKNEILLASTYLLNNSAKVIFDVGAHHGRFSAEVSTYFEVPLIYCFEPSPKAFKILENNLNGSSFQLTQIALSNNDGEMDFYINEFDETNSLLPSIVTGSVIDKLTLQKEIIKVEVSTIDNFCEEREIESIDLLKIDVQGNTLNVLRGAERLLKSKKIRVVYCEVEFLQIYKNQSLFHHVSGYLEGVGYSLYSLYNIHYDVNNRISWADALYTINEK